ncbi:MAG: hypothetical protein R6U25_10300 [Alkalispirochaeta sp.]
MVATFLGARDQSGIAHSSRMVLATADTPPYSDQDGTGLYDELLQRVFTNLDISLTIRHLPSERGLIEADQGRIDGEFARTGLVADEYPNLLRVPAPLSTWDFVAITRSDTPPPESFGELGEYHVAFINGWKVFETNVTDYRSLTLVENEEQLFAMLLAEHVEVVLYGRLRAADWMQRHSDTSLTVGEVPLIRRPMYLLLHRKHADLISRIAAEITRVRDTYPGDESRSKRSSTR